MIAAMRTAAENAQIADAKRKAESARYSFSQLALLDKSPEEWFNRYIAKSSETEMTPAIHIGNVVDKLTTEWGYRRLAEQKGQGKMLTPDEFEKMFVALFTGNFDPSSFISGFDERERNKFTDAAKRLGFQNGMEHPSDRYRNALAYVRAMPFMLPDEEILEWDDNGEKKPSVQVRVRPDFGTTPSGSRVNSIGFVDLITRNKHTGQITEWDTKANSDQEGRTGGINQVYSYSTDPAFQPSHIGILAYNDPEHTVTQLPFSKERQDEVRAMTRDILAQRFLIAEHGDSWDFIRNQFYPGMNEAAERTQTEAEHQQSRSFMEQGTGMAMAKAMTLQNDITEYEQRMQQITQQLQNGLRRRSGDQTDNPWESFDAQLNASFDARRRQLVKRGANKEDLVGLDEERRKAAEMFDKALMEAAGGEKSDIVQTINALND